MEINSTMNNSVSNQIAGQLIFIKDSKNAET